MHGWHCAAPNQQIEPSVDWLLKHKGKEFFLVGSDYVFPRTANSIIKAQLKANEGKSVGEDYIPLGSNDIQPAIATDETVPIEVSKIYELQTLAVPD